MACSRLCRRARACAWRLIPPFFVCIPSSLFHSQRVGLYFSAHWCPPCRGFTPELVEFYEDLKETDPSALEIVFVSSDHDVAEFNAYFGEMPWLALPYADRARKDQLAKHFQVASIPCLVFLNPDGSILTKRGRDMVSGNPNGFPWVRK